MNVFGIGLPEMAVIAAIALLVFGPKRLPDLGRSLGRTLKGFQTASSEFEQEFRSALSTAEASDTTPPPVSELPASPPSAAAPAAATPTAPTPTAATPTAAAAMPSPAPAPAEGEAPAA
ncbi:MAG: TatA/E family twin arginine-targeting protein translocase [Cyanobium sp. PLM2.Bin73]|jgi:sec-independent protein translocase protein TatA|nr:MAG: TatA/E family twin arginine-targeting protein translocase [Cyanobium sp. PLM2.Bin73]